MNLCLSMGVFKSLTTHMRPVKIQAFEVSDHSISARSQGGHRAGHRVVKRRTDAVAPLSRIVLAILRRRLTCLSIFATVMIAPGLERDALAGLTFSLSSGNSIDPDFGSWPEERISSGVPARPAPNSNSDRASDNRFTERLTFRCLAETGGAGAPVVPVNVAPVALVFERPVQAPPPRSFRYLRETAPQLQQPANRELLDPPKHG